MNLNYDSFSLILDEIKTPFYLSLTNDRIYTLIRDKSCPKTSFLVSMNLCCYVIDYYKEYYLQSKTWCFPESAFFGTIASEFVKRNDLYMLKWWIIHPFWSWRVKKHLPNIYYNNQGIAVMYGHIDIMEWLLNKSPITRKDDQMDMTDMAIENNQLEMLKFLVEERDFFLFHDPREYLSDEMNEYLKIKKENKTNES